MLGVHIFSQRKMSLILTNRWQLVRLFRDPFSVFFFFVSFFSWKLLTFYVHHCNRHKVQFTPKVCEPSICLMPSLTHFLSLWQLFSKLVVILWIGICHFMTSISASGVTLEHKCGGNSSLHANLHRFKSII